MINHIILTLGLLICFSSNIYSQSKIVKPLRDINLNEGEWVLLIHDLEDTWVRVISDPEILEKYRNDLVVHYQDYNCSTSQFNVELIKDHQLIKNLGFCSKKELSLGNLENHLSKAILKQVELPKEKYQFMIDSLKKKELIWQGSIDTTYDKVLALYFDLTEPAYSNEEKVKEQFLRIFPTLKDRIMVTENFKDKKTGITKFTLEIECNGNYMKEMNLQLILSDSILKNYKIRYLEDKLYHLRYLELIHGLP